MRHNIQIMVDIIISRFEKKISLTDKKFVQNAVFKLIHLEKTNLVYYKSTKKNISYKNVTAKLNQSKLEAESAEEIR